MVKENSKIFLLVLLGMLSAFGPFVTDMYLPSLPAMGDYFDTTSSMVQLGLTTSMVGLAMGQVFFGPLSDRYGRRMPLLVAMWLFLVSTVFCLFAQDIQQFVVFRLVQGVAGAGGIVISRSVATDKYSGKDLAKMLAVIGAINGVAPVVAPIIGGVFTEAIGWQGIFGILLVLGMVLLVGCYRFRESLPTAGIEVERYAAQLQAGVEGSPVPLLCASDGICSRGAVLLYRFFPFHHPAALWLFGADVQFLLCHQCSGDRCGRGIVCQVPPSGELYAGRVCRHGDSGCGRVCSVDVRMRFLAVRSAVDDASVCDGADLYLHHGFGDGVPARECRDGFCTIGGCLLCFWWYCVPIGGHRGYSGILGDYLCGEFRLLAGLHSSGAGQEEGAALLAVPIFSPIFAGVSHNIIK